jgi:cysteine desulfurase/selenocysteine lyase
MIKEVSFEVTTYNEIPFKFEAGTPNIGDVIALKYAIDFVNDIGKETIIQWETKLLNHFVSGLMTFDLNRIKLFGTAKEKVAVQSFLIEGKHAFDTGLLLDAKGIAVRTGHHCTQPLMSFYGIEGTVRASFAIYNTLEEVDILLSCLHKMVNR